jgi:glycerol-3-phosphate O-acyltransferase
MIPPIDYLLEYQRKGIFSNKLVSLIHDLYATYWKAIVGTPYEHKNNLLFRKLIELVAEYIQHPTNFEIFHQSVREPFDYYQFGLNFIRPLIDFKQSKVFGISSIEKIRKQLNAGENVILFGNHQTEPDPQIISLLLEDIDAKLPLEMIFVAGHRVISDPMAIPMSMGRNLLCIYSKKHIDHPPEQKTQKISHNQRTLKKFNELLQLGGYCIYVAPSGGRDRLNEEGVIGPAPFNEQGIELFYLLAKQAAPITHFYPLTLYTYHIMPPPLQVEKEIGEKRLAQVSPVYLEFGQEIDMENFPGSENLDKKTKKNHRSEYIWKQVEQSYQKFPTDFNKSE